MLRSSLLLALLLGSNLLAPAVISAPAPPVGLQIVHEAGGGQILHGSLAGVSSASAAFRAGLGQVTPFFDASPDLLSVVQSKDGETVIGTFSANLGGKLVSGLMVAACSPGGASRFGALFDAPQGLRKSLPTMLQHFDSLNLQAIERTRPAAADPAIDFAAFQAAAKDVHLTRTPFPDRTATIGIAPGYSAQRMQVGQFQAASQDGAYANLYYPVSILDPRGALYRQMVGIAGAGAPLPPGTIVLEHGAKPVDAWKAFLTQNSRANGRPDPSPQVQASAPLTGVAGGWTGQAVSGHMTLNGQSFVFTGTILVSPPPAADGGWLMQIAVVAAPERNVAADMPALLAMRESEKVDMQAVRDQTMRNIERINEECSRWLELNRAEGDAARNARFEKSMADAKAAQANIDASAEAFIHYINDTAVVQRTQDGAQTTINSALAQALAKSDPQRFNLVPPSQYQPGKN